MATNYKANFKKGQRVKFYRTHDKFNQLSGTVVGIAGGDDDLVDVKSDEGNGSVSRVETVHASDVTFVADGKASKPAKDNGGDE